LEHFQPWPASGHKSNRWFCLQLESMDMEMRQLEYFIAVAKGVLVHTGSYG